MFLNLLKNIKENAEAVINSVKDNEALQQASTLVACAAECAAESAQALAADKLGEINCADQCGKFVSPWEEENLPRLHSSDTDLTTQSAERKMALDLDLKELFSTILSASHHDMLCAWGDGKLREGNVKYTFRDFPDLLASEDILGYLDATKHKTGYQCILFTKDGIFWAIKTSTPEFLDYATLACASFYSENGQTGCISLLPDTVYTYPAESEDSASVQNFLHTIQKTLWEKSLLFEKARQTRFQDLQRLAQAIWDSRAERSARQTSNLCASVFRNMECLSTTAEEQAVIFFLKAATAQTIPEYEEALLSSKNILEQCKSDDKCPDLASKISSVLPQLRSNYQKECERVRTLIHTILDQDDPAPLEENLSLTRIPDAYGMTLPMYVALYGRGMKPSLYAWCTSHPQICALSAERTNILGDSLKELAALQGSQARFWQAACDFQVPEIMEQNERIVKRVRNFNLSNNIKNGASMLFSGTATAVDAMSKASYGSSMGARESANDLKKTIRESQNNQAFRIYSEIDHTKQELYVQAWNSMLEHLSAALQKEEVPEDAVQQLDQQLAATHENDSYVTSKLQADRESIIQQYVEEALAKDKMFKDEFETTAEFEERKEKARSDAQKQANIFLESQQYAKKSSLLRMQALDEERSSLLSQKEGLISRQETATKRKELLTYYFVPSPVTVNVVLGSYNADIGKFSVTLTPHIFSYKENPEVRKTLPVPRDVARQFKADFDKITFTWTCSPYFVLPNQDSPLIVKFRYYGNFSFLDQPYSLQFLVSSDYPSPVLKPLPDFHTNDDTDYEE